MLGLIEFCELSRSRQTYFSYRLALCLFLESVYQVQHPEKPRTPAYIQDMDRLSLQYLSSAESVSRDLINFLTYVGNYSPSSQRQHFSTVLNWLDTNEIQVSRALLKKIKGRLPRRGALTRDVSVSIDELKRWHGFLSFVGRTMFLVQLSSGMRIGELIHVRVSDLNLDTEPAEIKIQAYRQAGITWETKNGQDRMVFLSTEAASAVCEWLKVREDWLLTACSRTYSTEKRMDDPRLFPMNKNSAASIYYTGLKKAGLYATDPESGRAVVSSHALRRFFMSQLKAAGMPSEMVELLAGHAQYLSASYRRFPMDQVRAEYQKASYAVCLNGVQNMPAIRADLEQSKETQAALATEILRIKEQLRHLAENDAETVEWVRRVKEETEK